MLENAVARGLTESIQLNIQRELVVVSAIVFQNSQKELLFFSLLFREEPNENLTKSKWVKPDLATDYCDPDSNI